MVGAEFLVWREFLAGEGRAVCGVDLKFDFLTDFCAQILGVNFKNRANFWRVSLRQILKSGVIFAPRI